MAEDFYLRVCGDRLEWLLLDQDSGIVRLRGDGDFATFSDRIRDMSWTGSTRVLVAGEEILLTRASIPSKQQRQILQALPYMVEENLATDVEQCHFAAGPRDAEGNVSVAVINKTRLQSMLEMLGEAGIKPNSVTPDVMHVPGAEDARVLVDGDRALMRTGRTGGMAMEQALLPTVVNLLGADTVTSLAIYVHPSQHQAFEMYLSQIAADFAGDIDTRELEYSPFEFLCRSFDKDAINLLQGEFKVEEDTRRNASGWRSVAILAACAFGLQLMLLVGRGIYLDVKANQYQHEARALYAEIFPGEHDVQNIRLHWQAHLDQASGKPTGVFFDLFSTSAQKLPGSQLKLENVNFSQSRGDLILQLTAPRYDAFDKYAEALRKAGLDVQIGTINQDANIVKGSIRIRPITGS